MEITEPRLSSDRPSRRTYRRLDRFVKHIPHSGKTISHSGKSPARPTILTTYRIPPEQTQLDQRTYATMNRARLHRKLLRDLRDTTRGTIHRKRREYPQPTSQRVRDPTLIYTTRRRASRGALQRMLRKTQLKPTRIQTPTPDHSLHHSPHLPLRELKQHTTPSHRLPHRLDRAPSPDSPTAARPPRTDTAQIRRPSAINTHGAKAALLRRQTSNIRHYSQASATRRTPPCWCRQLDRSERQTTRPGRIDNATVIAPKPA
jgi:hypothetical protein